MALTDAERSRVRAHLGYPEAQPAASIQLGIPAIQQTAFLVDVALSLILPRAEPRVRELLDILDRTECQLVAAQTRFAASSINGLKLREDETGALDQAYVRWAYRLAELLGCPVYPFAERFRGLAADGAGSIPVRQ